MNSQTWVNALAILGIVGLGIAAKFGPPGTGDQITLAAVSSLAGFIGGIGASHAASAMQASAPPPADPA